MRSPSSRLVLCLLILLPSLVFGQGSLTPPGTPAPTMKTLDQIEPRTLIPGGSYPASYTISQAGSYVLTGNIVTAPASGGASFDTIVVSADNVTVDLNGFSIIGSTGSVGGSGVLINGTRTNVTVRNGTVVGGTTYANGAYTSSGFFNGIYASSGSRNLVFENLTISNVRRGIYDNGFPNGEMGATARGCSVNVTASDGIVLANATRCVVVDAGNNGINASVASECTGRTNATTTTVAAINAETVQNSKGYNLTGAAAGIIGRTVANSFGKSDSGIGLSAVTASYCRGESTSGTGLSATIAVGCTGTSSSGTAISATNKYLMP